MTKTPSEQIDEYITGLKNDWRSQIMIELRDLINKTEPELEEGWKWSVGVWSYQGKLVCAFSAFKNHVKLNFFNGVFLNDKHGLFNNGNESKNHRSVDFLEGQELKISELKDLIVEAVNYEKNKV